jgi:glucose uptake protein GlcU
MPTVARVAVIVLGVACGVLAAALWNDAGSGDLSGSVILLGAVALALILIGAMATSPTTRPRDVRNRRRRR